MEVVVLGDQFLELQPSARTIISTVLNVCDIPPLYTHLILNIGDHLGLDLKLVQRHLGSGQELQEPLLARQEEQQALPALARPGRPSDPVDVITGIIGRVELDDPVDLGNVEPTGGDVGTEEVPRGSVTEFEKRVGPFLLLLLALRVEVGSKVSLYTPPDISRGQHQTHVQIQDRNVDIIQELGVILDLVTARKEHNDLFLQIPLQKGEEQQEPLVRLGDDVTLFEHGRGRGGFVRIDVDVQRTGTERDPGEVLHFRRLRGREEHGLSVLCSIGIETDSQHQL